MPGSHVDSRRKGPGIRSASFLQVLLTLEVERQKQAVDNEAAISSHCR